MDQTRSDRLTVVSPRGVAKGSGAMVKRQSDVEQCRRDRLKDQIFYLRISTLSK